MEWEFPEIKDQGRRYLAKLRKKTTSLSGYTGAIEEEIMRLMQSPDDVLSDHPGCAYCMEKGTPVKPGQVCSECGDRSPYR